VITHICSSNYTTLILEQDYMLPADSAEMKVLKMLCLEHYIVDLSPKAPKQAAQNT
jgi:hypothetical protein